jgi:hypothetical protein
MNVKKLVLSVLLVLVLASITMASSCGPNTEKKVVVPSGASLVSAVQSIWTPDLERTTVSTDTVSKIYDTLSVDSGGKTYYQVSYEGKLWWWGQ